MLYATTRSKVETFTAQRALKSTQAPDGGLFVPVRLPGFSGEEIRSLGNQTSGECIARVMNLFFGTKLSGREIDFRLGRNTCPLAEMGRRTVVAETWHNKDGCFGQTVNGLMGLVSAELGVSKPGQWMFIAARVAVLFAAFGQLQKKELLGADGTIDIAVGAGDFTVPMAAWYAREMGLPIGTIIISCKEESGIWDLIARGQMALDMSAPQCLERLVYGTLGRADAQQFVQFREDGGMYTLGTEKHRALRDGLYASVISPKRQMEAISNVCRTNGYILDPEGAAAYAGLMDYRAITGAGRLALMLCEESPVLHQTEICMALDIDGSELRRRLNLL